MTKVGTTVLTAAALLAASGVLSGGAQAREWSVEVVEHGIPAGSETGVKVTVGYDKTEGEWGPERHMVVQAEPTVLGHDGGSPGSDTWINCGDGPEAQTLCDAADVVVDAIP